MPSHRTTVAFIIDFIVTREGVTGGTERQLIETVNRLDRTRFRPLLLCLQDLHPTELWAQIQCERKFLHVYTFKKFTTLLKLFQLAWYLRKNAVDIVQTYFFDATIFGTLAAKIAGVPTVVACKRDLGFWYEQKLLSKLKYLNKRIDYFIVNCAAIKKVIVEFEGAEAHKIKILPNGIEIDDPSARAGGNPDGLDANPPGQAYCVGIVANFNREVKRVDLFIRAAHEVLKVYPHIKFYIIGGGRLEGELRALAQSLGIEPSIVFLGKIENPNIYLRRFNIGINCSDSEGLSNVILEYYANKLPVIATHVGGNPELVRDGVNGFLRAKGDYKGIAEAILRLYEDPEMARRMAESGYKMVQETYAWDSSIKKLEGFYAQVPKRK